MLGKKDNKKNRKKLSKKEKKAEAKLIKKQGKHELIEDEELLDEKKTRKERKAEKKAKKRKRRKTKLTILLILVIILVVLGIWLTIRGNTFKTLAKEMTVNENSIVIDTDGKTIAKLGSSRKNEQLSLENMPVDIKNAYVAIEDERFYSHGGVDIKRTGGAILSYIFKFGSSSYGGSTITQQLVKNYSGDSTDSVTRKVKEWWKAGLLESCLSKDEILQAYLNVIYVGPNIYGIEAGSKYYFNKSVSELTIEECAFLAGINHSPNSYNPFSDKDNAEKITKRTKTVLNKMLELGYINEESCNNAISKVDDGLNFKKGNVESESSVYSYHTDALITEIIPDIAKKYSISETFATNYTFMAGLKIQSTQDSKIQTEIETEFKKSKYNLESTIEGNSSQAAMVVIDHETGNVTGCVGGLGEKIESRPLNRATQSIRQTGSSIKPLAVLVPGIDKKIITASSIVDDTERDFADGYHPTDLESPLGKITVRRALESSQNVPFVEMMDEIKPKNSIKYLEKMGITSLTEEDNNLVLALGGLMKGISPLEMAGAYATIANDGEYIEPTFYTRIYNKSAEVIVKTKQEKRRVFSKEVAYILKELLTQPVQGSHGTAASCKINGIDVAAKTGTTDKDYDRWLCGFTPYYTAVTWFGYDQNETIKYNNKNPASVLWSEIMPKVHKGLDNAEFKNPGSVQSVNICAESGKKANSGCKNTYTEYFLWSTVPGNCDKHNGSSQSTDTKTNSNSNKGTTQKNEESNTTQTNTSENVNTIPNTNTVQNKIETNITNNTTTNTTTNVNKTTNTTVNTTKNETTNSVNTNTSTSVNSITNTN